MAILNLEKFLESDYFISYNENIRQIIHELLIKLSEETLDFVIKVRKDNAIALVPKTNDKKNICTLMIYQKHVRFLILNEYDKNIKDISDINDNLVNAFKTKYTRLTEEKVQMSIYLDSSIVDKLNSESQKLEKKPHDIIVETINEKINRIDYFLDNNHREEFSILIKDSGLYDETEKYVHGLNEGTGKAIALFYIISAYQNFYMQEYEVKFTYDKENSTLHGSSCVINDWFDEQYMPGCCMYGLITSIIAKEEINILDFFDYAFDDTMMFLFKTAIKILNSKLTITRDKIVKIKPVKMTGIPIHI